MIEFVESAKGGKVIRCDGRLLASRIDPESEAAEWLASRRDFIKNVKNVFVLGLGSGHHVRALLEKTEATVIVLEANAGIYNVAEQLGLPMSMKLKIQKVSSARDLRANEAVKAAVRESFVVLSHPASAALYPQVYDEIRAQLIGRDWAALNWQWKTRNAPGFDDNPRIDSNGEPLTIHDLEQTQLVRNGEEREKLLLRALRELVK